MAARQSGFTLGYESFERAFQGIQLVPLLGYHLGLPLFPTGSCPAPFLPVSASLVSKA
jgi:hypothetical protein